MISIQYLKFIKIIYIGNNDTLIKTLKVIFGKVIVLSDAKAAKKATRALNSKEFKVHAIVLDMEDWEVDGIVELDAFHRVLVDIPLVAIAKPNSLIKLAQSPKLHLTACIPTPLNIKYFLEIMQNVTLFHIKKTTKETKLNELATKGRLVTGFVFGIIFDKDDKILHANDYACSLLGYKEEELIGKSFLSSIFRAFKNHDDMKETITYNKQYKDEIEIFSRNGSSIMLKAIYTPEIKHHSIHSYTLSGFVITDHIRKISATNEKIKSIVLSHKKKENMLKRRIKELETQSEERYQKNIELGNNALLLSLEKARNKIAEQTTQLYMYEDKIKSLFAQIEKLQEY